MIYCNNNDDQPHPIKQSTIIPNAPIIIMQPGDAEFKRLKVDVRR